MQIPFPHVLSTEKDILKGKLRVVTNKISDDKSVYDSFQRMQNKATGKTEMAYNHYQFDEIKEERPARGNWSNYDGTPTYYSGTGKKVGLIFESELST